MKQTSISRFGCTLAGIWSFSHFADIWIHPCRYTIIFLFCRYLDTPLSVHGYFHTLQIFGCASPSHGRSPLLQSFEWKSDTGAYFPSLNLSSRFVSFYKDIVPDIMIVRDSVVVKISEFKMITKVNPSLCNAVRSRGLSYIPDHLQIHSSPNKIHKCPEYNCNCKVNLFAKGNNELRTISSEFKESVYIGDTLLFEGKCLDMPIWEVCLTLQQEKTVPHIQSRSKSRPLSSVIFTREGIENRWYEEQSVSTLDSCGRCDSQLQWYPLMHTVHDRDVGTQVYLISTASSHPDEGMIDLQILNTRRMGVDSAKSKREFVHQLRQPLTQ